MSKPPRAPRPDWPENHRAPEPTPKAAHAAEIAAALASTPCPVQIIPRGVSGLADTQIGGTRWAWLLRTEAPEHEQKRMALAAHRGPSRGLASGCARMAPAYGGGRGDDW